MTAFISATPSVFTRTRFTGMSQCLRPVQVHPRPHVIRRVQQSTRMSLPDATTNVSTLLSANPAFLQTIADSFATLGMPKWLVEWGHPAMMTFMVLGMGTPGAVIGWKGRLNENKKEGVKEKKLHENIMLAFFLLAFLGGTGGTLSVAMQGFDVWQSPHFLSAATVLALLGINSVVAYSGFTIGNDGSAKGRMQGRKLHSYFGVAAMAAFLVHGILGANILLGS